MIDELTHVVARSREPRDPARVRVRVSRREAFSAAHQLWDLALSDSENRERFGKCANLHGHNYAVEVVIAGDPDAGTGYVINLTNLSDIIDRRILRDVDHHNLNTDVAWLAGRIPTAENLATAFWERLDSELPPNALHTVRVWETEKNWAECSAGG